MARFEEEIVERWYVIRGYLIVKNISYSSPAKRAGGKGRGEIDLLAVKLDGKGVKDRVRCEVSVSITQPFPFISKTRPNVDEVYRLVKKFFSKGAHFKTVEYLGSPMYRCELVSGELANNYEELLRENLPRFGAKLLNVKPDISEGRVKRVNIKVEYKPVDQDIEIEGVREIEIIPFQTVMQELREEFEKKDLTKKDFPDPIMRSIQYLIKFS
jgi:hypothetical protein